MKYVTIIVLFLVVCCSPDRKNSLPYFNTPDFTPEFLNDDEAVKKITHTIPAFSFTDQNGKSVTDREVKGKIYVADFFFSRCTSICPKMTNNMKKIAEAFTNDNEVVLLSHSVTPDHDSVAALKKYAENNSITQPNWHLLTGDKEKIYTIARKGYFADERLGFSADTTEFLHTENFILVDKNGRIRGVYNGTLEVEVDNLVRHISILKKED
jgi:protein SCO1